MIKIAICDDDLQELMNTATFIDEYKKKYCKDILYITYQNPIDLLEVVKEENFDIILLDILMPQMSGIQVAQEIKGFNQTVKIIFLTSSREFAVESYAIKAYHYILKPITESVMFLLLKEVIYEIDNQNEKKLIIKYKSGIYNISLYQLEGVEVIGKTLFFYLIDGSEIKVTGKLSDFEPKLLCHEEFFKTHRAYIVNMKHIKTLEYKMIITHSNRKILIARAIYSKFKEEYLQYMFSTGRALL